MRSRAPTLDRFWFDGRHRHSPLLALPEAPLTAMTGPLTALPEAPIPATAVAAFRLQPSIYLSQAQ